MTKKSSEKQMWLGDHLFANKVSPTKWFKGPWGQKSSRIAEEYHLTKRQLCNYKHKHKNMAQKSLGTIIFNN